MHNVSGELLRDVFQTKHFNQIGCLQPAHQTEGTSVCAVITLAQRGGRGVGRVNMLASHLLCESDKVQLFSFSMRTLVSKNLYVHI